MESNKRKSPPFYSQSPIPRPPLTVVSNIHQHSNPHSHHPRMNAPRLEISQDTMRLQWQSSGKMAVAPSCHVGTRCRTSHRASSGMGVADGTLMWYRGWGWGCGACISCFYAFWCAVEVGGVVVVGSCAFHVMELMGRMWDGAAGEGMSALGHGDKEEKILSWSRGADLNLERARGCIDSASSRGQETLWFKFLPTSKYLWDVALLVFPFPGTARRERPRNATSTKPGAPPTLGGALSAMASWCPPWRMRPDATELFDGTSPGSAYLVPRRGQRRQACIIDHIDLSSLPGVR